jgi:1,6-anhydro-N-acetylmuramate kinase
MKPILHLTKIKNRRFLILSAGGPQSAIQGIYINIHGSSWSVLSHTLLPYPEQTRQTLDALTHNPQTAVTIEFLGRLDRAVSNLFLECAKTVCMSAQKSLRQPHAIILNKLELWKESREKLSQSNWNLELGDARLLSSHFNAPVATDFARNGILAGGSGDLPLFRGICGMYVDDEGIAAHITIGQLSRLFIYDARAKHTIFDTDAGPGTCLINMAANESGCPEGFDRDGSFSSKGKVFADCLETLASQPIFSAHQPKHLRVSDLTEIFHHPCLSELTPHDKAATLTALTARTIFDIYKNEYHHVVSPRTIWISGGGANNLTLFEFLKTYFAPTELKRIDDIGIPAEMFVPMALGLTINADIIDNGGSEKLENNNEIKGTATWVFP